MNEITLENKVKLLEKERNELNSRIAEMIEDIRILSENETDISVSTWIETILKIAMQLNAYNIEAMTYDKILKSL